MSTPTPAAAAAAASASPSTRARFPLFARMLVWLLVHVSVLGGSFALFVVWQFHLGLDSLLFSASGDRLRRFGEDLSAELRSTPESSWPQLLKDRAASSGLQLSLRGESMPVPIGDLPRIPGNVSARLDEIRRQRPRGGNPDGDPARVGGGAAGRAGEGAPRPARRPPHPPPLRAADGSIIRRPPPLEERDGLDENGRPLPNDAGGLDDDRFPPPPPEDEADPRGHILDGLTPADLAAEDHTGTAAANQATPASTTPERPAVTPFFLLRGDRGDGYWSALDLPVFDPGVTAPRHLLLIVRSQTASARGLFFDLTPWLQGGLAVFVLSLLVWAPFFLGLTRYIRRLSRATESIAGGKFDISLGPPRSDELGVLGHSIESMASRLDRLVTGQKRFLADVAHELCSPLARIRTGFGVLEHSIPEAHRPRVESIDEDVEELSRLVSEVLAFTKASTAPGSVRPEPVELLPIIHRALSRECPGQTFEVKVPEDLRVLADRNLLDRAIANVLRNAHRHAGPDCHLRILAQANFPHLGQLQLSIIDDGPGVNPADLPRLFEPFYRPDAARTREAGGAGLGLAIVRSAIEASRGTVHAEPATPRGLAIIIRLPLVTAREDTPAPHII